MRGFITGLALLLCGCASTIENTWYQLPSGDARTPQGSSAGLTTGKPVLWVQQVSVPDYLAGNGVVYQTSDVKYVIATSNLWASPLDQQLQQTLVASLSRGLPDRVVASAPYGESHDTLNVHVTGFHGRYDGRVIVSGEWLLQHQGRLIKQPFSLALPQQKDGYDALVRTLGEGWQQVAAEIARQAVSLD